MTYRLEDMTLEYSQEVIDIFNHYVSNGFAAYGDQPVEIEHFNRFLGIARGYPAMVVKDESGTVVGFAFLHPYRSESTFHRVAEITYFIHPDHTGKGLGTRILKEFVEAAKARGIDTFLASISSRNEASLRFHVKHGFEECGRFRRIGRKFGQDFDVVWMQLAFWDEWDDK
jgi:L-amino acid N-acyltransferase YncA